MYRHCSCTIATMYLPRGHDLGVDQGEPRRQNHRTVGVAGWGALLAAAGVVILVAGVAGKGAKRKAVTEPSTNRRNWQCMACGDSSARAYSKKHGVPNDYCDVMEVDSMTGSICHECYKVFNRKKARTDVGERPKRVLSPHACNTGNAMQQAKAQVAFHQPANIVRQLERGRSPALVEVEPELKVGHAVLMPVEVWFNKVVRSSVCGHCNGDLANVAPVRLSQGNFRATLSCRKCHEVFFLHSADPEQDCRSPLSDPDVIRGRTCDKDSESRDCKRGPGYDRTLIRDASLQTRFGRNLTMPSHAYL